MSPLKDSKLLDWLNLAVGASLSQYIDGYKKGNRQRYVVLDIETKCLFRPKRLFWKTAVNSLISIIKILLLSLAELCCLNFIRFIT